MDVSSFGIVSEGVQEKNPPDTKSCKSAVIKTMGFWSKKRTTSWKTGDMCLHGWETSSFKQI